MPSTSQPLQLQPQLYTMAPLAGRQNETRKYTTRDWDAQRLEITRLYDNGTLESVMKFMRDYHRLDAT